MKNFLTDDVLWIAVMGLSLLGAAYSLWGVNDEMSEAARLAKPYKWGDPQRRAK